MQRDDKPILVTCNVVAPPGITLAVMTQAVEDFQRRLSGLSQKHSDWRALPPGRVASADEWDAREKIAGRSTPEQLARIDAVVAAGARSYKSFLWVDPLREVSPLAEAAPPVPPPVAAEPAPACPGCAGAVSPQLLREALNVLAQQLRREFAERLRQAALLR